MYFTTLVHDVVVIRGDNSGYNNVGNVVDEARKLLSINMMILR
jgi:hypothetical protein